MSVEDQVSFSVGVVELHNTPPGPLVCNGQRPPVKDDGRGGDGEKVFTRVIDLHRTTVLHQIH